MFRPFFPLSIALCAFALTACTVDENGNIIMPPPSASAGSSTAAAPRISQVGTCFMFVTEEGNGKYSLTQGVGDGSANPVGEIQKGLSAAKVDAVYASERAVMDISPECLAILATDRSAARPAAKVVAKPATGAATATKPAART